MDKRFINENIGSKKIKRFYKQLKSTPCKRSFNKAKACSLYNLAYLYMPTKTD
jgi:hypothetical protein